MKLQFYKYHGTGNDFILIDNRKGNVILSKDQIRFLCHRRFGIGADVLMLLKANTEYDFEMDYYNSDGAVGSMCGNGGRCITAFAVYLGVIERKAEFVASDGPHKAIVEEDGLIKLQMVDVHRVNEKHDCFFLDTGSPHYVKFVNDVEQVDVYNEGKKIRFDQNFHPDGTNVNFVSVNEKGIAVRTYERGVEDETYSCGTGSVASAIAHYLVNKSFNSKIPVKTLGGNLEISFNEDAGKFTNVYLKGPAKLIFKGEIEL